eukprot:scaffold11084_cov118-Isochrysis_galbana.AAC.2
MTDTPIDHTQAREQDAPDTHDAKRQAPVHGHTGDVPSDKALSDSAAGPAGQQWWWWSASERKSTRTHVYKRPPRSPSSHRVRRTAAPARPLPCYL